MKSRISVLIITLLNFLIVAASLASTNEFRNEHIQISIVNGRVGEDLGVNEIYVGVLFKIEPGWHIYWKNPGDTGLPTQVNFSSMQDLVISTPLFPVPSIIPYEDMINLGYSDQALMISRLGSKNDTPLPGKIQIDADISWVLCKDECIPGSVKLSKKIQTNKNSNTETLKLLTAGLELLPKNLPKDIKTNADKNQINILFEEKSSLTLLNKPAYFIPEIPGLISDGQIVTIERMSNQSFVGSLKEVRSDLIANNFIPGLLLFPDNVGYNLTIDLKKYSLGANTAKSGEINWLSLIGVLFCAFIGGLILNLMPCVFPVLSIKILGILEHGNSGKPHLHGVFFAVGVLTSFWALAGLLLILRSFGSSVGWGFQFQSPVFVTVMAFLLFTMALSLSGVFEFGASIQNMASSVKVKDGYAGSFGSGVLATALATPCTAPFMGSAIAAALVAPCYQSLLIFTALGIGMASPYLMFLSVPSLTQFLPRPGVWMESFKQWMAFPMYMTVVWLSWVLEQQLGQGHIFKFGTALVLLSMGFWIFGRWSAPHRSINTRRIARIAGGMLTALSVYTAFPIDMRAQAPQASVDSVNSNWSDFSQERFSRLRSEGKTVLVDFTAAWCLVCQINHKRIFESEDISRLLSEKKVALLRADWTSKDEEITKALEQFGQSGVPLVVVYKPKEGSPDIFSSLIDPTEFKTIINSIKS